MITPGDLYTYLELQKTIDDRVRELVLLSVEIHKAELEKLKVKLAKDFKKDPKGLPLLLAELESATEFLPSAPGDIASITHGVSELPLKNTVKKKVTITTEVYARESVGLNWFWDLTINASTLLVAKPEVKLQKIAKAHIKEIRDSILNDTKPQKKERTK